MSKKKVKKINDFITTRPISCTYLCLLMWAFAFALMRPPTMESFELG